LYLGLAQVRFDLEPFPMKVFVARTRRQRQVQLGACGAALARLTGRTCSWIQGAPILVDVREERICVGLERVEHAVPVVRVDVDVGDPLQAVPLAQQLDRNAAIVEDAEARRMSARGVMQPRDRDESAPRPAAHDLFDREHRGAHHHARGLVDAPGGRRITRIEVALARGGFADHELDIVGMMEAFQLVTLGDARIQQPQRRIGTTAAQFAQECFVPVEAERMTVAEAVAAQGVTGHHQDRGRIRVGLRQLARALAGVWGSLAARSRWR
jgi:hypothetical protein